MVKIIGQSYQHMGFAEFFPEGAEPFDVDTVFNMIGNMLEHPAAGAFVAEHNGEVVGCAAVVLAPFTWNARILSATEVFWHMRRDVYPSVQGKKLFVRLLNVMTEWAREQGAAFFVGVTRPGPAGRMLERRGFKPMEATYGGAL